MSKGHTIPLLHLARLLLRRQISVTLFTTAANLPFISHSLTDTSAVIIALPFPENIPGIPAGVESTDALPSISLFYSFVLATELMKPHFERALRNLLPRVSFMASDGFLWWTHDSASKLGFPRFVFYGMSSYAMAVCADLAATQILTSPDLGEDDLVTVTSFPWIKVTKNDFDAVFKDPKSADPLVLDFLMKTQKATERSSGMIVSSFYEIEAVFADYWDKEWGPKTYCVGPLCLAYDDQAAKCKPHDHFVHQWLDEKFEKLGAAISVLYVAFGTQAEISPQQMKEIAKGLEESEVNFVWVMRKRDQTVDEYLPKGYEERVRNRGIVVRDWVDQKEILKHESVRGFMSHCGWNSVMESVCSEVPILAWPMMAEQPMNARMVAEEMKVGLRVERNCDGFVEREEVKKKVKELMEGETGKKVRKKVKEVADMARKAVAEGGSSSQALDKLIKETCG